MLLGRARKWQSNRNWAKIRCYAHKFNLQKGITTTKNVSGKKLSPRQNTAKYLQSKLQLIFSFSFIVFKDFWITETRFMSAKMSV